MKKIFFTSLILFILLLAFFSSNLKALSEIDLTIKANIIKTNGDNSQNIKFEAIRNQDEHYTKLLNSYLDMKKTFDKKYKDQHNLISESSTVKQAFAHSKDLLDLCIEYLNKYSDLKDAVLLELLVGPWTGKINIDTKNNLADSTMNVDRDLDISFQTNQAGQISKGVATGADIITVVNLTKAKKLKNKKTRSKSEPEKRDKNAISGTIIGNIVPNSISLISLKVDNAPHHNKLQKSINNINIKTNTSINITPIVHQEVIDRVFSITVSNMKIYYSLFFEARKDPVVLTQEKYNKLFKDLMYLLKVTSGNYISQKVYRPLHIYPRSKYINDSYDDYVMSRRLYYGHYLSKMPDSPEKLETFNKYLTEMIELSSISYMGIVDIYSVEKVNLDLNSSNTIDSIFYHYYKTATRYYKKAIAEANSSNKQELQKELGQFERQMKDISESGLIHSYVLTELGLERSNKK